MTEKAAPEKQGFTADWLMRGGLSRLGDIFDKFTGRRRFPTSSLATSELIERVKRLLDAEARQIPGKGTVVPHSIKLRIEWDKFSTDAEDALTKLQTELLVAAIDHINDSLYYTYAPVRLDVKPDYFIEGVKLSVSFDRFGEPDTDVEMNVTIAGVDLQRAVVTAASEAAGATETYVARFEIDGARKEKRLAIAVGSCISVGRTGTNELVLDDASVSKIHASLVADQNGELSVADTGSTNGTFINDQRIAYGKATRLVAEDNVKFGTVEVTFEHLAPTVSSDSDKVSDEKTVEIDGFEFTGRDSAVADISPAIEIPKETLELPPSNNESQSEGEAKAE